MNQLTPLKLPDPAMELPKIPTSASRAKVVKRRPSRASASSSPLSAPSIANNSPPSPREPTKEQIREEKRRLRKIQHSDIERRRRTKINEQFDELKGLIPACSQFKSSSGGDVGLHKLVILQHTVQYIKHLNRYMESIKCNPPEPQYNIQAPPQCFNITSPPVSPQSEAVDTAANSPPSGSLRRLSSSASTTPQLEPISAGSLPLLANEASRIRISNLLS